MLGYAAGETGNFPDYYAFRSIHLEKELHVTTRSQASAKKEQLTCLHDRLFFLLQIFGERHNEKIRSIFEMGSALLHVGALISILQKKQPVWAAFSVKGRVYYYDKPNIGSCLFFSFNIFLPIGEGVPAAFRGRGLQAEVKGGVLSTSFVVYCKNMDKV